MPTVVNQNINPVLGGLVPYIGTKAAYNPITFDFTTPLYPYGGSLKTIANTRAVNNTEITNYALTGTEMYIELSQPLTGAWRNSKIQFVGNATYVGVYTIKEFIANNKFILNAKFTVTDNSGSVGRYLENFQVLTKIVNVNGTSTLKALPDIDNKFYFDISPFTQSMLTYKLLDADNSGTILVQDTNNLSIFSVTHATRYTDYDVNGEVNINHSGWGYLQHIYVHNAHLPYVFFEGIEIESSVLNFNRYIGSYNSVTPALWLTNAPRIQDISEYESYQLSFFKTVFPTNVNWDIKISYYENDGTLISTDTEQLPYSTANQLWVVSCGMSNLSVPSNCDYYIVKIETSTEVENILIVEEFRFNVVDKCGDNVRLLWETTLGSIDAYTFRGKLSITEETERNVYKKRMHYLREIGDKEREVFSLTTEREYFISSKHVSKDYQYWLAEINNSPNVWWELLDEDGNPIRLPVVITSEGFELKNNTEILTPVNYAFQLSFDLTNKHG